MNKVKLQAHHPVTTAARALDRFIEELQKSTPVSTPEPKNTPDI